MSLRLRSVRTFEIYFGRFQLLALEISKSGIKLRKVPIKYFLKIKPATVRQPFTAGLRALNAGLVPRAAAAYAKSYNYYY